MIGAVGVVPAPARCEVVPVRSTTVNIPRPDLVRRIQVRMDALTLAVQRYPRTSQVVRLTRRAMAAPVRVLRPHGVVRREVRQARRVMADAPPQPTTGPKVLIVSYRAWATHNAIETTIAQALRLRGARCEFLYCGGGLPICEMGWPAKNGGHPCGPCSGHVGRVLGAARFPTLTLDELVPADERARLARTDLPPVDEAIDIAVMWYFRSGMLDRADPEVAAATHAFRITSAIMEIAAERLLDRVRPDVVVLLNGKFIEERRIADAARRRGIRVFTYEIGTQRGTVVCSTDSDIPAVELNIDDLWAARADIDLGQDEERELDVALAARRGGGGGSQQYYRAVRGVDRATDRPLVAVFTNVSWDTAVIGKDAGAGSMFEWLDDILAAAEGSPFEIVVRVHPAETRLPALVTREQVAVLLQGRQQSLPTNVRVVPPEEPLDTYALIDAADAVMVFSSTVGLEAAALGKPVAVAGGTHYRGRGFTLDLTNRGEVAGLLRDDAWMSADQARTARARRYAHAFLCRAMVPFRAVEDESFGDPVFRYDSVAELAAGRDAELDAICAGILTGRPVRVSD